MTDNVYNDEWDIVDLEPYENGYKKMMYGCSHEGCDGKVDITKEYITMEEQNNIRKQCDGYNPACDKLYIFTRYCEDHESGH